MFVQFSDLTTMSKFDKRKAEDRSSTPFKEQDSLLQKSREYELDKFSSS